MRNVNRRDAVKLAAGLAAGTGLAARAEAKGDGPKVKDTILALAKKNSETFTFVEQVTFKTSTTEPRSFNLVIATALDEQGVSEAVIIRQGTTKIFRADSGVDDVTKKGGVHWTCGAAKGTFEFKEPGALVLAVREQDGTVRCYSLGIDYRC